MAPDAFRFQMTPRVPGRCFFLHRHALMPIPELYTMPKTTAAIIVSIAIGLSATATWAAQPSFDCAKATHDVEKLICEDAGLAELDQSLAELYATVLKHTPDANKGTLKAEQRGWVKGRNDCWKASDMRSCVADDYRARINELKDR
jgi:uncharacterized protein